jgi:hypothetical protein
MFGNQNAMVRDKTGPHFFRNSVRSSVSLKSISQGFVPVEAYSRPDHREMRKRLGEVANLQPSFRVIFFSEKAEIVSQCEQTVK